MDRTNRSPDSLSLIGHLDELRSRILWCLGLILAGTLLSLNFSKQIVDILKIPASKIITSYIVFQPTEIVSVYVKVAIACGIILASPAIFYHIWKFMKPVVPMGTRASVLHWTVSGALLFIAGVVFMYLVAIPLTIGFLIRMVEGVATPMITLNAYISLILVLTVSGGLVFEIPVVSGLLTAAGIITPSVMRKKRKEAIFGFVVIAAVITPTTDVFNMLLFALPMIVLYEMSIIVSSLIHKARLQNKAEELYAIENQ
jgi:sec-independent protein translocase protein TatC